MEKINKKTTIIIPRDQTYTQREVRGSRIWVFLL